MSYEEVLDKLKNSASIIQDQSSIEEKYIPIFEKIQQIIDNTSLQSKDSITSLLQDPLYKELSKDKKYAFNKAFQKFTRLAASIISSDFKDKKVEN